VTDRFLRWMARTSRVFVWVNLVVLAGTLVLWPLTQFTVQQLAIPVVLALSWAAIAVSAWGNLLIASTHDATTEKKEAG
jgi:hypothetical protein